MRLTKIVATIIITLSLVIFLGTNVSAALGWYTCSVVNVGKGFNISYVRLTDTDGSFTNKWFQLNPDTSKEMFAIILTAVSMDENLLIKVDPNDGTTPTIYSLYLAK
jgi:hypothetical protein